MTITTKKTHGGKRQGAGRKPGHVTANFSTRARVEWIPILKAVIAEKKKQLKHDENHVKSK